MVWDGVVIIVVLASLGYLQSVVFMINIPISGDHPGHLGRERF